MTAAAAPACSRWSSPRCRARCSRQSSRPWVPWRPRWWRPATPGARCSSAPASVARVHEETDGAPLTWLGHSAGGAAGLCWLSRVAAAAPLAAVVTLGTPGPRRLGPVRWSLAATTIGLSRLLGRFPSRALGFGSEDEAAGILAEGMRWDVKGSWVGTDGFDYFAALGPVRTPYLAVAGGSDRVFAPVVACRHVIDRVGSDRKTLTVEAGLSHRGLVLSPKARESCWTGVGAWLKETLA